MTGATGFLGSYVLRDLLERGRRVVALIRPPAGDSTRRLCRSLQQLGFDPDPYLDKKQLLLVEGELPERLPDPDWGRTDEIISSAASLQLFSNGNLEPHKTNVLGVERLIDWACRHDIRRIHAVSTAYVCGYHDNGHVSEVFHHPKPTFQTDYEHTKWDAEARFAAWSETPGNVLTIMRPSFLVGDSKTGHTTQFGGFYQLARMIGLLKAEFSNGNGDKPAYIPLRIPGLPYDPQNFVPVDFAARLVAEIVLDESLHGRIYHLTDPSPPTNEHVKRCLEAYFNIRGGFFIHPSQSNGKHSRAEALLWEGYDVLQPRVSYTPVFQSNNTRRVMESIGAEFPALDRERIFTLLDFATANRWGSRSNRNPA